MKIFIRITALLLGIIILMPVGGVAAENARLENARDTLTFKQLSNESITSVKDNLVLPVKWADCFIVWESKNENLLDIVQGGVNLIGRVIRPPFGEGDSNAILRATIIDGDEFVTKNFSLVIPENEIGYIYSSTLDLAKEQFDFDFLSAQNIFEIHEDVIIPKISDENIVMSVETDRAEILDANGKVTRNAQRDETVCLTVTFREGNEFLKRSYPIIVKAFNENEIKTKLHEDVVNAKNSLLEKYNTSGLNENLLLPAKGGNSSSFVWTSSDVSVIADNGTIYRQSSMKEAVLTLTATLEGISESITIDVRVAKSVSAPETTSGIGSGSSLIKPAVVDEIITAPDKTLSFSDVPESHWAFEEIEEMKKLKILDGTGNGKFEPDIPVTREQAVKLIVNTFDVVCEEKAVPFTDVEENAWYMPFIRKCYSAGIIKGISNDSFGVGEEISRQDFSVMLLNAMEYCGKILPEEECKPFADEQAIEQYAKRAVSILAGAGIFNGMPDGSFVPYASMTRAQAAAVLYRAFER